MVVDQPGLVLAGRSRPEDVNGRPLTFSQQNWSQPLNQSLFLSLGLEMVGRKLDWHSFRLAFIGLAFGPPSQDSGSETATRSVAVSTSVD